MVQLDAIPLDKQQEAEQIGTADLVVGLPTYNNAETVGHVVQRALAGLRKHFPSCKSVLIHSDGGSEDRTSESVRQAANPAIPLLQVTFPTDRLSNPAHGLPGQVHAVGGIFRLSQKLGARVCVLLDARTQSITGEWMESLVRPALEKGYDLIVPCFRRHRYDAAITNSIVYPLVRSLYGKRVRQPVGSDFALSGRLLGHCLKRETWDSQLAQSCMDIWLVVEAICQGFQIGQVFLGEKVLRQKGSPPEASAILAQVLGALFTAVEKTAGTWQKIRGSEEVPSFGSGGDWSADSTSVPVKRMIDTFRLGHQTLQEIWGLVLSPATLVDLKKLALQPDNQFRFGEDLWTRIVYDFALGYRLRVIGRDHLLRALTPLYLGWVASFVLETESASVPEVEARWEKLCFMYEAQKPYLISRWRWPDRFNP